MRPAAPDDLPFLKRLFLESREDLAAALEGNPLAEGLMDMQFRAKTAHYKAAFPNADERVLTVGDQPIGRLTTIDEGDRFHIVDIAVLRKFQRQGFGTAALLRIQSEGAVMGKSVSLTVALGNPARQLYERIGFQEISRTATDATMLWTLF